MAISPPSSYTPLDRLKIWLSSVQFGASLLARRLNFSNNFVITEDGTNNFYNIDVKQATSAVTGTGIANGTASQTVFVFAHNLGTIPTNMILEANSTDAMGDFTYSFDGTNVTITYQVAPPSGNGNLTWNWIAVSNAGSLAAGTVAVTATSVTTFSNKTLDSTTVLSGSIDFDRVISLPVNPSANVGRVYVRQVDANNDGLFIIIKKGGNFVEVQIA